MSGMDDLAAFLTARLDEDEAAAKAAQAPSPWKAAEHESDTWIVTDAAGEPLIYDEGTPSLEEATHIALHDPHRTLREVEADRYVLAKYRAFRQELEAQREAEGHVGPTILATFRTLGEVIQVRAAIWRDHPDFRPGWKP